MTNQFQSYECVALVFGSMDIADAILQGEKDTIFQYSEARFKAALIRIPFSTSISVVVLGASDQRTRLEASGDTSFCVRIHHLAGTFKSRHRVRVEWLQGNS